MFTTRHYSFMSVTGILIWIVCVGVVATSVFHSYQNAGKIDAGFGGIGLFSMLLDLIGVFCGIVSLGERDIYIAPAIAAIVLNGAMILAWVVMILISIFA